MRVLHLVPTLDPKAGGVIEAVNQLIMATGCLGLEHAIASLDFTVPESRLRGAVPVYAVGSGASGFGYAHRFTEWLGNHISEFDAVIVHGLWQYHSWGAWRVMRRLKVPYYVFPHGMLDPWFKREYPFKHVKKWLYWPWAEYRVLRDARAVLFTCEEERRLARESFWLYRCREEVVGLGTLGVLGDAETQRGLFLRKFPHLHNRRCLLFLGRLHEKKGPDLLLAAFARLRRDRAGMPLHLIMAGPNEHAYGREMQALARQLGLGSDLITWTGMLQGDLKWGAFHAAEAFILPSHQENFGIAVAEALSAGVPVLLGKGVNIWPEIVRDSAGLVEEDSLDGTYGLLMQWFEKSSADIRHMRACATRCFVARYRLDHVGASLRNVLVDGIGKA